MKTFKGISIIIILVCVGGILYFSLFGGKVFKQKDTTILEKLEQGKGKNHQKNDLPKKQLNGGEISKTELGEGGNKVFSSSDKDTVIKSKEEKEKFMNKILEERNNDMDKNIKNISEEEILNGGIIESSPQKNNELISNITTGNQCYVINGIIRNIYDKKDLSQNGSIIARRFIIFVDNNSLSTLGQINNFFNKDFSVIKNNNRFLFYVQKQNNLKELDDYFLTFTENDKISLTFGKSCGNTKMELVK